MVQTNGTVQTNGIAHTNGVSQPNNSVQTNGTANDVSDVCIVGAGPAGLMLA